MRLRHAIQETNLRAEDLSGGKALEKLSLSQGKGVVPSSSLQARTMEAASLAKYKVVYPEDLVLSRFNAYKGALGASHYHGVVSPDYFTAEVLPNRASSSYLEYLLLSQKTAGEIRRDMSGMGGIDPDSSAYARFDIKSLLETSVPVHDVQTQRRIAAFLDRETGQIDETITRIDRVVDLIEERHARLHRGAFSENHPTTSLVTIAGITLGKMLDQKNTVGDPTEYLRAANVRKDGTIDLINTKQMLMTKEERERYKLQAGDILMVEGGDAGRVALLPDDLPGLAIQKTLMRIRINDAVADPAYCYLWIDHLHKSGVLALDYSVSTIAHFTAEKAQRIRIPLPPLEVQKQTAKNLQAHNLEVEEMIRQTSHLKSLLEERRSALITAAVTGRIEV